MPMDQCARFDDDESISPIEQSGKSRQYESEPICCAARFHFPFHEKSELLSKEQILGSQGCLRPETQPQESKNVTKDAHYCTNQTLECSPGSIVLSSSIPHFYHREEFLRSTVEIGGTARKLHLQKRLQPVSEAFRNRLYLLKQ